MDNVDGKQARRTGTSSGLGELFELRLELFVSQPPTIHTSTDHAAHDSHGIDSLNCTLASLCETAAMGIGPTKTGAFTALVPCLPMFFSTWETYHTHTLYLGYFNGPTEGLILACLLMFLSGYYGPQVWNQPLSHLFGPHLPILKATTSITSLDIFPAILLLTFLLFHLPFCILNVIRARRAQHLPILPVFLEWTPMLIYTLSITAWLSSPYSTLLSHNHLALFCITMSFVFGRMTTKIILAHLTRQPFPFWTVQLAPLIGGAVLFGFIPRLGLAWMDAKWEVWYLRAYCVFAAVVYGNWAVLVVTRICAYLGINCLTIPGPPRRGREGGKGE